MIRSWTPSLEAILPAREVVFPLTQRLFIGSHLRCHIRLRDRNVPPVAGSIAPSSMGIFAEPEKPGALRLNDAPLSARTVFLPGDLLTCSNIAFSLRLAGGDGISPGDAQSTAVAKPVHPAPSATAEYAGVPLFRLLEAHTCEDAVECFVKLVDGEVLRDIGRIERLLCSAPFSVAYARDGALPFAREVLRKTLDSAEIRSVTTDAAVAYYLPLSRSSPSHSALLVRFDAPPDDKTLLALVNSCDRIAFVLAHFIAARTAEDAEPALDALMSNAVTGLMLVDSSGRITRASPVACSFFDTEPLPPVGRRFQDLVPGVSLGGQRVMQVVHRGDRAYQVTATPHSATAGWFVEVNDVTLTHEAQRQADQVYEAYRQMPDIAFVLDEALNVKQASIAAELALGQCLGRNLRSFCSDPDVLSLVSRALAGEDTRQQTADCNFFLPSGEKVPARVRVVVSQTRGRRIFLHAADLREILKIQESALRQERMASVGTLAAGVAHEFNNLLSALEGYAGLASRSPEHAARLPELVTTQSRRAAQIIRSLLSFGRSHPSERIPSDINRLLDQLIVLVTPEFIAHKVELHFAKADIPAVEINQHEMQQVFLNILLNARQAIGRRGRVDIRTWRDDRFVYASIKDNGPGMPPDVRARIFLPFFTTKGAFGGGKDAPASDVGTGLGLTFAYNVVTAHKGEILVETAPGKGAEFIVKLPATDRPAVDVDAGERPAETGPERPEGLVILVVEDEPSIRDLIRDTFSEKNEVILCRDADEAARKLPAIGVPDVILMDLMMPGNLDGFAFFDLAKRVLPMVPVIIMTGRLEDDLVRTYRSRAEGFLAKPFEIDHLERAVAAATQGLAVPASPVRVVGRVVVFNGRVPKNLIDDARRRMLDLLASGADEVVLDLTPLSTLPSSIAGLLPDFATQAAGKNLRVKVICSATVQQLLEGTGLLRLPNVNVSLTG